MNNVILEEEILSTVKSLNKSQKSDALEYLKGITPKKHSTSIHRKRAMKQIRKALETQP